MFKQRLKTRTPALALIGHILAFLLAGALIFYGVVLLLLALKAVSPSALNDISAYRTVYQELAGLRESDLGRGVRIIAGAAGLLAFAFFGYLGLKQLPRPYLARHDLELVNDERGVVTVAPRAIERVAESAAAQHPAVTAASGRYGDDHVTVGVAIRNAREAADDLTHVQAAIAAALEQHGLPPVPVHLTLIGYERRTHRELN